MGEGRLILLEGGMGSGELCVSMSEVVFCLLVGGKLHCSVDV